MKVVANYAVKSTKQTNYLLRSCSGVGSDGRGWHAERRAQRSGPVYWSPMQPPTAPARNQEQITSGSVAPNIRQECGPPVFELMIRQLVPSGNRAQIRALLEHRASWSAIKHWRKRRRVTPQWALDLLRAAIRLRARAMEDVAALPGEPPPRVALGLAAWRAQRAAEKEKAAQQDGPPLPENKP